MRRGVKLFTSTFAASALVVSLAACGSDDSGEQGTDAPSDLGVGPINIWYATNDQEIEWGEQVVAAWNTAHPDQQVTANPIPAGSSSEDVITASITAGNVACLVYNTAPSAVPMFQKQGGLVNLSQTFPDAEDFISTRSGAAAEGFRSGDGDFYQMPWKTNPFMLYYNKDVLTAAGLDGENPDISTYEDMLAVGAAVKETGAADFLIYPPSTADFTNVNFDFYPFFLANSGGKQFVEDGSAAFTSPEGIQTLEFWQALYANGYSSPEAFAGDMWAGPFADGIAALGVAGPWGKGIFDGKVNFDVLPIPTHDGKAAGETYTFADSKNIGLYTACENQQTAWDFLKFSLSDENDLAFLEITGQFPTRNDVTELAADFLAENPFFVPFAEAVPLAVDVPTIDGLAERLQLFRDAWTGTVQGGSGDIQQVFDDVAGRVDAVQ